MTITDILPVLVYLLLVRVILTIAHVQSSKFCTSFLSTKSEAHVQSSKFGTSFMYTKSEVKHSLIYLCLGKIFLLSLLHPNLHTASRLKAGALSKILKRSAHMPKCLASNPAVKLEKKFLNNCNKSFSRIAIKKIAICLLPYPAVKLEKKFFKNCNKKDRHLPFA